MKIQITKFKCDRCGTEGESRPDSRWKFAEIEIQGIRYDVCEKPCYDELMEFLGAAAKERESLVTK